MTQLITREEVKLFQKLVSLIESISTLLVTGKVQNVTSRHLVKRSGVEKHVSLTSMSSSSTCGAKSGGLAAAAMCESLTWRQKRVLFEDCQVDRCCFTPVHCL